MGLMPSSFVHHNHVIISRFLPHNQIFDIIIFDYDAEIPWIYGPLKLDMRTLDRVIVHKTRNKTTLVSAYRKFSDVTHRYIGYITIRSS